MYCSIADIKSEFKNLSVPAVETAGVALSEPLLTEWITQESNYIDGKISVRYVTPVVSGYTSAYSILKRIAIFRVCERVKNKIEVKSNVSQANSEEKYIENYIRTPNYDLDQIAKGNLILKDVPLVNSSGDVGSSCGVECDTSTCHTFDVGKQQW